MAATLADYAGIMYSIGHARACPVFRPSPIVILKPPLSKQHPWDSMTAAWDGLYKPAYDFGVVYWELT